ncbi:hypothetical protein PI125_g6329 [Phytophthora idaei]|nr:hypothetical protein PI125_g6329 [Phytophthora idaei]
MSLDFVFGLPADDHGNTGILVFVCRLSMMAHLAPVPDTVTGEHAARQSVDGVFRHHGLPETFVSDREPRFTAAFWQTLFQLLGGCTCLLLTIPDGWPDRACQPGARRHSAVCLCDSPSHVVRATPRG